MTAPHSTYDEIPYPDLCYAHSHPGRLAAISTLLGLNPTPVPNCRVLELGCAGGGNLIPMAYGLPEITAVGVDSSARQITAARQTAANLQLTNIQFHALDILDITPDFGQFDYIIAHGVYSWVPPDVQAKVLSICKENLAPNGVAYVSYNTLPGWHMLLMIREMMLYHTRHIDDPQWRARAARQLVSYLATATPNASESAYAAFLNTYLETRPKQLSGHDVWEDAALLHDELEAINDPLYFHQFMERAAAVGLQYIAEANFPQVMPNDIAPEARAQLQQMADDTLAMEQYLDFLRHNTFRRTLLCHADLEVDRTLRSERVQNMYISSRMQRRESDRDQPQITRFRAGDNATFSTDHPVTAVALEHLSDHSPQAISFRDLVSHTAQRFGIEKIGADDVQTLAINLLQGFSYSMQLIEFHAHRAEFTLTVSERPLASRLARQQVQISPIVSNLRHERVELDPFAHVLLPYLDGQHDRAALLHELRQIENLMSQLSDEDDPDQALANELTRALNWLARTALLEA